MQFGTNHLGHFALTDLLLAARSRDRVVTVASGAHRMGKIDLDDLNWEQRAYKRWRAYGQSKLANLLFMLELQRRLAEAGSPVRAVAAHPGYAATNLQSRTGNALQNGADGDRQPAARPERRAGRLADAVRGHPGHPGRQLRRPGRPRRAARAPDARLAELGGARDEETARGAVGAVRAPDRRDLRGAEQASRRRRSRAARRSSCPGPRGRSASCWRARAPGRRVCSGGIRSP